MDLTSLIRNSTGVQLALCFGYIGYRAAYPNLSEATVYIDAIFLIVIFTTVAFQALNLAELVVNAVGARYRGTVVAKAARLVLALVMVIVVARIWRPVWAWADGVLTQAFGA